MISHKVIKNTNKGVVAIEHYLNNDIETVDYYSVKNEVWKERVIIGDGLKKFCLENKIENDFDYFNMFSNKKRMGLDLTLSFAKDISILSHFDDDIKAITRQIAVEATREMNNYIYGRFQENGERDYIKADGVFSIYEHNTSRELDPQLHYHIFLHNKVLTERGTFSALQANLLIENKFYINVIANYKLSQQLQLKGYQSYLDQNGNAKILTDENIMMHFSKRRQELLKIKNFNELDREMKERIVLATRKKKEHITQEDLKKYIEDELKKIDIDIEKISKREYKNFLDKKDLELCYEITLNDLTEKDGLFTKETFIQKFLINLSNISKEKNAFLPEFEVVNDYINEKFSELMIYNTNVKNTKIRKNYFSSYYYKNLEESTLRIASELYNNKKNIATLKDIEKFIKEYENEKGFNLTNEQKNAIYDVIKNRQITVVQGYAGTGKTASAEVVGRIAKANGYDIIALSPTGKAAEELGKSMNCSAITVDSFLLQNKKIDSNTILFVDEAGMLSVQKMNELLQLAKENNCKIVLQGDIKQLKSVEAGDAFGEIQKKFIKTFGENSIIKITDIRRQKIKEYKELTVAIAEQNFTKVFDYIIKHKDIFIKKYDINKIQDDFMKDFNNSLIICSQNAVKDELNNKIRSKLKDLEKSDENLFQLKKKVDINNINQLKINDYYKDKQIIEIDYNNNFIRLDNNKIYRFTELDKDNFYKLEEKFFAVNERIIALKNDKNLNIKNGEMFYIKKINGNKITIKNENKEITVNINEYNYFDYAYAVTSYKSQGMTVKNSIVVDDGKLNYNHFYVATTRGKEKLTIYTNDLVNCLYKSQFEQQKKTTGNISSESNNTISKDEIAKMLITNEEDYNIYSKYIDSKEEKRNILNRIRSKSSPEKERMGRSDQEDNALLNKRGPKEEGEVERKEKEKKQKEKKEEEKKQQDLISLIKKGMGFSK